MMIKVPFFSIVIPTYNRVDFITTSIESLLDQDFNDFEIIVVDDGSTDDTEGKIKSIGDARVRFVKKNNEERGAARNTGIQLAKGRYITFLDSDDVTYPNHLSTAFDFLSKNNHPELFHVAYEIKNISGIILKKMNGMGDINEKLITGNPLSCIGVFVRHDIMVENLFIEDRELAGLEDWELWLRMAAKYRFQSCNRITCAMIQHPERSVIQFSPDKLIRKMEKFIFYVFGNALTRQAYGSRLKKTSASVKTYTALHLAIGGAHKKEIQQYLIQGILENPFEVFRRRFFVILKLVLLK